MDEPTDVGFGRNPDNADEAAPARPKGSWRKALLLAAVGMSLFLYAMIFIYAMNRPFLRGKTTTCKIERADSFCWRRQLFGYSIVEQGVYACWKMHVRTPDGALLLLTQYRKSKRLKDLTHECDSFEGCGSYSPTCRLNDRGDLVILFWRFPVLQFVLMLLAAVFLFALALRQLYLFKTWAPFHAAEEDRVALSPRDVQCAEEGSEGSFDETLWDATVHSR